MSVLEGGKPIVVPSFFMLRFVEIAIPAVGLSGLITSLVSFKEMVFKTSKSNRAGNWETNFLR